MNLTTNTDLFRRLGEPGRMRRIADYDLFHPDLAGRFDRVAAISAERLDAPVAMVSILLDSAQFIVGSHGLPDDGTEVSGAPAEWSMCTHTVLDGRPYCVTDSTLDPLHADNPLLRLTGFRSYAGVPLIDDTGHVLGTHCVLDTTPRTFTDDDLAVLTEGATEIMRILGEHRVE